MRPTLANPEDKDLIVEERIVEFLSKTRLMDSNTFNSFNRIQNSIHSFVSIHLHYTQQWKIQLDIISSRVSMSMVLNTFLEFLGNLKL